MSFAKFFDRTFVLNLADRTDRLRHVERQLRLIGMPIDGARVRRFEAIKPDESEPFAKSGSKGCYLSILEILSGAAEEGLDNVLILQDDATFLEDFNIFEEAIVSQLQTQPWDLAQFGYVPLGEPSRDQFRALPPSTFGTLQPFSGALIRAHCFAVNGAAIPAYVQFLQELLTRPRGHPDGGPMPIDGTFNVYSRQPNITRLVAVPSMVAQFSSRSDVTPSWFDRSRLLRPLASLARRGGLAPIVHRWRS
jgi:glycosyl transferase, family 25